MAFKAATVFRSPLPGMLASMHGEEKPSEESSCGGDTDTDQSCVEEQSQKTLFSKKNILNEGSNNT